jgi:hypothetical protein
MKAKTKRKFLAFLSLSLFTVVGTYNAVMINSESSIGDAKFAKRLDEVYGIIKPGREVAAAMRWEKIQTTPISLTARKDLVLGYSLGANSVTYQNSEEVSAPIIQAAVQEELNLQLVEVINPKKWQQGLKESDFNGSLNTNNGVIESLSVSLPNGEGLSVSFSEMTGNVFEYDMSGSLFSGMMYQIDQNSYMVTLTNGPLEGTRLRFTGEASMEQKIEAEESERVLAENQQADQGGAEEAPVAENNDQSSEPVVQPSEGVAQMTPEQLQEQDAQFQEQVAAEQNLNPESQDQIM